MTAAPTDERRAEIIDKQIVAVMRIEEGIALIRSGQINSGLAKIDHAVWDMKYLLISAQATTVL